MMESTYECAHPIELAIRNADAWLLLVTNALFLLVTDARIEACRFGMFDPLTRGIDESTHLVELAICSTDANLPSVTDALIEACRSRVLRPQV